MRPVRMANHFSELGIKTAVIAGCPTTYGPDAQIDASTEALVRPEVQVYRAKLAPPRNKLWRRLIQSGYTWEADEDFGRWRAQVLPVLHRAMEEFRPDFVLMTTPPFSLHSLAQHFAKHYTTPLIVDFRDAWSQWILTPYPTYLHYLHRLYCERALIKRSFLTTATSRVTLQDLARLHGKMAEQRLLYIPNSFDKFLRPQFSQLDTDAELNILYLGSFYFNPGSQALLDQPWYKKRPHQWLQYAPRREDWSFRGPQRLLKIFDRFLAAREDGPRVRFTFAGRKPEWWDSVLTTDRLRQNCVHLGPLPKDEALKQLARADALAITSSKVLGGADYSIAGKTYEYLASRKPIIAFVCEGAQRDLLATSGAALCLDPENIAESARQLDELLAGKIQLCPNQPFIEEHLTGNVLERLLETLERRLLVSSE